MRKRLFDVLPGGDMIPRCIRIYMQKRNPTVDYITVVYTHASEHSGKLYQGRVVWRGYSGRPFHPCGFAQWGETEAWRFGSTGSRVKFTDLPKDTQLCVIMDYGSLWGYKCGLVEIEDGWRIKETEYVGINMDAAYTYTAMREAV